MESHPHLSLKREKDGRHQADSKGSPYRQIRGNEKWDAVLTGENVVNVDYLLYIQEKQEIKYIGENWYIYYTALQ